jgi:hypothetical protein
MSYPRAPGGIGTLGLLLAAMYSPRCWRRKGTVERADVISLLWRLKQAYPQDYAKMTRVEAEEMVSLWADMLGSEDPDKAMTAVNALIAEDTRGFPPKVGQVLAKIRGAASPHVSVAWMKPYIEQIAEQEAFMPSISRYAREHGMTWEAAAAEMAGGAP